MNVHVNGSNCRINFKDMSVSNNPPSLKDALTSIQPFDLSDNVKNGSMQIAVSVDKELCENVRER